MGRLLEREKKKENSTLIPKGHMFWIFLDKNIHSHVC